MKPNYKFMNKYAVKYSFKESIFQIISTLKLLNTNEKNRITSYIAIFVFLSFLDLIGVALVGIVGVLATNTITGRSPGIRTEQVLNLLKINNFSVESQTAIICILAVLFLISKTILNLFFNKKLLDNMSRISSRISNEGFEHILYGNKLILKKYSSHELAFALTNGVINIVYSALLGFMNLISEFILLFILAVGLLYVDLTVAVGTFVIFGMGGFLISRTIQRRSVEISGKTGSTIIENNKLMYQVINSLKEIHAMNRQKHFLNKFTYQRQLVGSFSSKLKLYNNINKYFIETIAVLGMLAIASYQFLQQDSVHAIGVLAIFLAASSRIAPSINRLQQSFVQVKGGLAFSKVTLNLYDEMYRDEAVSKVLDTTSSSDKKQVVIVDNLDFKFPDSSELNLSHITFEIKQGEFVALVGPSGSGKSTLFDLVLGFYTPTAGKVEIFNREPKEALKLNQGLIGFVPQDVHVIDSSLAENLSFGIDSSYFSKDDYLRVLEAVNLQDLFDTSAETLEKNIGENGSKISVGQRQRIGIARALMTKPKLLMLDEATSSLDANTESIISNSLKKLHKNTTIFVIAHRLSTIKEADKVIYLDKGKILAIGKFEEVKAKVPDFLEQARIFNL